MLEQIYDANSEIKKWYLLNFYLTLLDMLYHVGKDQKIKDEQVKSIKNHTTRSDHCDSVLFVFCCIDDSLFCDGEQATLTVAQLTLLTIFALLQWCQQQQSKIVKDDKGNLKTWLPKKFFLFFQMLKLNKWLERSFQHYFENTIYLYDKIKH